MDAAGGGGALAEAGRALIECSGEVPDSFPTAFSSGVSNSGKSMILASQHCDTEDWPLVVDALFDSSECLSVACASLPDDLASLADCLQVAASELKSAAEIDGCMNIGPPAAAPNVEISGQSLIRAARGMGYSAAGARLEEAGEALVDLASEWGDS